MKIARRNVVLAGVLTGLLAVFAALESSTTSAREVGPLLPGLAREAARSIELDAGGATLALERAEDGWGVRDAFGHPARPERVQRLLDRLVSLTTMDLLSRRPENHEQYGVAERERGVRVYDGDGELLADLIQGDARTFAGGTGHAASFVRRAGDDAVYRAPRFEPVTVDLASWLDNRFLTFEPALVDGIRLRFTDPARSVTLERRDVDRWVRESGEAVSSRAVRTFLDRAGALFFGEVEAASETGAMPTAMALELELERTALAPLVARFGPPDDEDGSVLAIREGHPWIVRFDARTYALIEDAAEALVSPP